MPKALSRQAAYSKRQEDKGLVSKRVWVPAGNDEQKIELYAEKLREKFLNGSHK